MAPETTPAQGGQRRQIVDAQIHLWKAETPDRPWVPGRPPQMPEPFTIEKLVPMMDEAGVDVQILSHLPHGPQRVPHAIAVEASRKVNDRLYEATKIAPKRLYGLAAVPTSNPEAAADELERTVMDLGFRGGLIHGTTDGRFLDDRFFWPIFARAEELDVPIYLHPGRPLPAVIDAYYKPYAETHPALIQAALVPLSIGLMTASGLVLAQAADRTWIGLLLTASAAVLVFATRFNPLWVLLAGGSAAAYG